MVYAANRAFTLVDRRPDWSGKIGHDDEWAERVLTDTTMMTTKCLFQPEHFCGSFDWDRHNWNLYFIDKWV